MATILIVDDEPNVLELVRVTLEEPAIRIIEAADGESAIEQAQLFQPDLILLDVHLPDMSGVTVCRLLRHLGLTRTSIVMLTAATQADDVARGYAAGATHYLTKPFSPVHLLSLVERLLPARLTWLPR